MRMIQPILFGLVQPLLVSLQTIHHPGHLLQVVSREAVLDCFDGQQLDEGVLFLGESEAHIRRPCWVRIAPLAAAALAALLASSECLSGAGHDGGERKRGRSRGS